MRVSDPSTASATANVIITVRDVNEPPAFDESVPTFLRVRENAIPPVLTIGGSGTPIDDDSFDVTDEDSGDTTFTYSVSGDDREVLEFDADDVLVFKSDHEPNFEEKSSYSITITASSASPDQPSRGRSASLDVTIEVVDTEDPGEVSLSQRQPQVGREVHAALNDPDGGVRIDRWEWERSAIAGNEDGTPSAECSEDPDTTVTVVGGWTTIAEASSAVYTPSTQADAGRCLRARVTYTDNLNDTERQATGVSEAATQDARPANAAPRFVDQDLNSPGDQSDRTSRKIAENREAGEPIGTPVTAFDEDDALLIYTLNGVDAAFFDISRDNGQLMTKASLNYEARNSYVVVVTATDPSGASDNIQVTINVTNVHDPVHISGVRSVRYPENDTEPVASYTAFDEAGHDIRWFSAWG